VAGRVESGDTIAAYVIEDEIGQGGMGVVYRARHTTLEREVALKVLGGWLQGNRRAAERFLRESQLAAELHHPNIVTVYDAGETDGRLWIAMQLIEGGEDLGDRIEATGGPLSVEDTLNVLDQIASALDAAHALGLVHRDVKPSNVMLQGDHAYLTDFGVMRRIEGGGDVTRTGEFMGTIEWAAPELIDGGELSPATDVYALGCVLYACLAARIPYQGETPAAVINAHLQEPPPKLPAHRELQPVLDRAMAKQAADRYQTAGELAQAARAAAGGEAVPAAAPHRPRATGGATTPGRSRRWWWIGAGVALVAVVVVAIVLLAGGGDDHAHAGAYERAVRDSDTTLTREVEAVAKRDAQGGSLDARIERNIQVRDATERAATRLEHIKAPESVARDHAVLVDGYRLLVDEYDDAITAARHGDGAALTRVERRFVDNKSASAQQIHRASARIEAALPGT
jgi:hypothetical protein